MTASPDSASPEHETPSHAPLTIAHRISRVILPLFLLALMLGAYRLVIIKPQVARVEPAKNDPWMITPRFAEPRVATDEQLVAVLNRVKPPMAKEAMTNNFVHALRLWGPKADFHDEKVVSGHDLQQYFLDDQVFRKFAGEKAAPLFYRGRDGLEVRSFDEQLKHRDSSSYHTDDLLATFAESGLPLTTPIVMRNDEATIGELLNDSLMRFHLERLEYEWTAIVFARYVFPLRQWKNKYGGRIDVNELVKELVAAPLDAGPCNGLHRLEALAVLYRIDEEVHALQPRTKRAMLQYMKRVSDLLVAAQAPDGSWSRSWPAGAAALEDKSASLHDKLLVTGHQLEWLAYAPDDVQPPRETIVRGSQWLVRTLTEMDEKELLSAYGPYTHAARALCLWRGVEPYVAWQAGQTPSKANGG
ncbi:hypothetical protein ETAA8_03510 [Anatilimnocola aggregata]|uniref:Uncharacterized protein n=1 Tax=Anatilimnocola aggregata TaxID=2528021 RepID=A0A517Y4Y2_9BACT|nr:hypothetical protein [Anatilimnocola aggregata]QDU25287.1 hypothetical protein ETAA8_03510 [Anatilimnocola aggregata]